jgi:tyrosyl-tRNA synthetase
VKTVYDEFYERGFIKSVTDEACVEKIFGFPKLTCYIGFDPTAESLHVGNLLPIMALAHMQQYGHRTIVLMGDVTAMIGDPSGKDTSRQMMKEETIQKNVIGIKQQMDKFLSFNEEQGLIVSNSAWLRDYKYIDFMREVGIYFNVNTMIKASCFSQRMERDEGLTFLEFSYMLLQGYDFLHLYRKYNCLLQMGGDDQWSNILAGMDLVRKKDQATVYGLTFPLLITAYGHKMGKTEAGAIWLDNNRTSVHDFYQYWRNTEDSDVHRFLKYFTFIEVDKINELANTSGEQLNKVKSILAYEVTKLIHGEQNAREALIAEKSVFGINEADWNFIIDKVEINKSLDLTQSIPKTPLSPIALKEGPLLRELLKDVGLVQSISEGRRLIQQGGVYINRVQEKDIERTLNESDMLDGKIELRVGKKKYHTLIITTEALEQNEREDFKKSKPMPVEQENLEYKGLKRLCVVLYKSLEGGEAANVAAIVIGGLKCTGFDDPMQDSDSNLHAAVRWNLPVLKAKTIGQLEKLLASARELNVQAVAFTRRGQSLSNSYQQYAEMLTKSRTQDIEIIGVGLFGSDEEVKALTKSFTFYS